MVEKSNVAKTDNKKKKEDESRAKFVIPTTIQDLKKRTKSKVAEADKHFNLKEYEESLQLYTEIMSWCPRDADLVYIYNQICECYFELHQYLKAFKFAEKCLEFSPKCIRAHRHLIMYYIKSGDLIQAEKAIKTIEKLEPSKKCISAEVADLTRLKNYLSQSEKAYSEKDYKKVLECVDKCCGISPLSQKFQIMKAEISSALGFGNRDRVYTDNAKFVFANLWKKFPALTKISL